MQNLIWQKTRILDFGGLSILDVTKMANKTAAFQNHAHVVWIPIGTEWCNNNNNNNTPLNLHVPLASGKPEKPHGPKHLWSRFRSYLCHSHAKPPRLQWCCWEACVSWKLSWWRLPAITQFLWNQRQAVCTKPGLERRRWQLSIQAEKFCWLWIPPSPSNPRNKHSDTELKPLFIGFINPCTKRDSLYLKGRSEDTVRLPELACGQMSQRRCAAQWSQNNLFNYLIQCLWQAENTHNEQVKLYTPLWFLRSISTQ